VIEGKDTAGLTRERLAAVSGVIELAGVLRQLRRREARRRGGSELTYRELAASTGWSHAIVGQYLTGKVVPPTDRFDVLVRLLGASPAEQGALATARDRVAEGRRDPPARPRPARAGAPAQLPAGPAGFTGRAAELAELDGLLAAPQSPSALVISAVSGTAGVGKTALAVHWAHRVAADFPDGQLYVNLRGYDPEQPMPPGDALAGFLRALGVSGADIPADLAERAARFRTEVSGRRMLVVLDNAAAVEQVRPLLPGTPACLVLVTSRDSLAGLVAQHGAHRLQLGRLPEPDAIALLRRLIGAPVGADPAAARALAAECARLPLALRVAAELAAARAPTTPLAELVSELADRRGRLDLLDAGGDPRAAVRAVFSWSYQHLPADTGRTFRLLGLHPGADWDRAAVAALTGDEPRRSRALLAALARAHLIQPAGADRFGMHDLLRGYAAELTAGTDPAADRHAALTGLLDHYLATAAAAMDALHPGEAHRRPRVTPAPSTADAGPSTADAAPSTPAARFTQAAPSTADCGHRPADPEQPALSTPDAAVAWLDAERANLVAVAGHAAQHGWPGHAIGLAGTLFRYLDAGGRCSEALALHTHALRAARDTGDAAAQASALTSLGGVYWRQGRYAPAVAHVEQALAVHRRLGDRAGEARALANLGRVGVRQGRLAPAEAQLEQALALFVGLRDQLGEARMLDLLGFVAARQGRLAPAEARLRQALALFGALGDRLGEAESLGHLGTVRARQGRYEAAAGDLRQALTRYRDCGHRDGEAYALAHFGLVSCRLGDLAGAADQLDQAGRLYQRAGDRLGEAQVLVNLGLLAVELGQPDLAGARVRQALELFEQAGDRAGEAEALNALGEARHAAGDHAGAAGHHTAAAELADRVGDQYQRARAFAGLAQAQYAAGDLDLAREHEQRAAGYAELSGPPAPGRGPLALLGAGGAAVPSSAV